jgi:hypothetical protein
MQAAPLRQSAAVVRGRAVGVFEQPDVRLSERPLRERLLDSARPRRHVRGSLTPPVTEREETSDAKGMMSRRIAVAIVLLTTVHCGSSASLASDDAGRPVPGDGAVGKDDSGSADAMPSPGPDSGMDAESRRDAANDDGGVSMDGTDGGTACSMACAATQLCVVTTSCQPAGGCSMTGSYCHDDPCDGGSASGPCNACSSLCAGYPRCTLDASVVYCASP